MSEQNDLQSFYYTFGTSEHFPYQKGWVEVKAPNRQSADRLFRKHHPDHTEGIINCAFIYDQKGFEDMRSRVSTPSDWAICHEVLSAKTLLSSHWSEIRNDYFSTDYSSEQDGATRAGISIDAWKTPDENEQGTVIATVLLSEHGDILVDYRDQIARWDSVAQECIQDAISQLKEYAKECGIQRPEPEASLSSEDICETLRADGQKGFSPATIIGVTMYHLAAGMEHPIPIEDLRVLAEKVNVIQSNSNHAFSTEEAVSVVRTLCRTGLDFSKLSSQDPFYQLFSEGMQRPVSQEVTRQALIRMPDDAFAELIADFAEKNRDDIFSGHHRIDVTMSEVASEWITALRGAEAHIASMTEVDLAASDSLTPFGAKIQDAKERVGMRQIDNLQKDDLIR